MITLVVGIVLGVVMVGASIREFMRHPVVYNDADPTPINCTPYPGTIFCPQYGFTKSQFDKARRLQFKITLMVHYSLL